MNKYTNGILQVVAVVIILFLGSCSVSRQSAGGLYETFYVGEEGTQYFIKPLAFESGGSDLQIDFTLRYLDEIIGNAKMNFTVTANDKIKSIDSLRIENHAFSISSQQIKLLFNEKSKKGNISRFSSEIPLASLSSLMESGNWIVWLHEKDKVTMFNAQAKTLKSIQKLQANIFDLFKE